MSYVFLSENANYRLKNYLHANNAIVIEIKKTNNVYPAVASHPDIYMCSFGNEIIISPEQSELMENILIKHKINYSRGSSYLGYRYPANIKYNGARIGNYFVHNLKYTDELLLKKAKEINLRMINVKQGYSKCSLVAVDDESVITADRGMEKQLKKHGIEVLTINQGSVMLKGFDYGFLGGASGRIGDKVIFNGNLELHPDFEKIVRFIEARKLKVVYFKDYPLEDIGSVIEVRGLS